MNTHPPNTREAAVDAGATDSRLEVHPDRRGFVADPAAPPARLVADGTLAGVLAHRARNTPDAVVYYLPHESEANRRLTAAGLFDRAQSAAAAFAAAGLGAGQRMCLCLDTSADLLAALYGAALLGAVPTVIEPPLTAGRRQLWLDRVRHIVAVGRPSLLVCAENVREAAEEALAGSPAPVLSPPFASGGAAIEPAPAADPEAPAYIQFTSGTTASAKGIVLSHRAIREAVVAIGTSTPIRTDDVIVGWLPLHHDMGLVGITATPMLLGISSVLIRPFAFGARPDQWLRLIHQYRATISSAPNFAYRLVSTLARRINLSGLDLSCWRVAFNGAEMVDADTLDDFCDTMAPLGFRPESLRPCYGMAELGLAATFSRAGTLPRVEQLSRSGLAEQRQGAPARSAADVARHVSCGVPVAGTKVRVVDADDVDLPDRHVGRVLVASRSMMSGYLDEDGEPVLNLRDGWLDTGDLGFLIDGELFVTGRSNDLIILAGRNYQPQMFELAAETVDEVRRGGVAAVGLPDLQTGTEQLFIVVESRGADVSDAAVATARAVERAVRDSTGVRPGHVLVVVPRTLPKTPSGKLQRGRVRAMIAAGTLGRNDKEN